MAFCRRTAKARTRSSFDPPKSGCRFHRRNPCMRMVRLGRIDFSAADRRSDSARSSSNTLYRSGRIHPSLLPKVLDQYGIDDIVSLTYPSNAPQYQQLEHRLTTERGIRLLRFPLSGNGTGDPAHVVDALIAIHDARRARRSGAGAVRCRQRTHRRRHLSVSDAGARRIAGRGLCRASQLRPSAESQSEARSVPQREHGVFRRRSSRRTASFAPTAHPCRTFPSLPPPDGRDSRRAIWPWALAAVNGVAATAAHLCSRATMALHRRRAVPDRRDAGAFHAHRRRCLLSCRGR